MRGIRWNHLAKEDFYNTIDFLLENWSEREAQNFIDEVYAIINILRKGNVDFQQTDIPGVRRCALRKQITLFYKTTDKNTIELLRFWNTYKDDQNLQF